MAYNGKLLGRAHARLADIREKNTAEHERRLAVIYANVPGAAEDDARLRAQMIELARLAVSRSDDTAEKIKDLKNRNLELQKHRTELITAAGYPPHWLDDIYSCDICRDTGYTKSGAVCECLRKLYNIELSSELSSLLKRGNESFENFDPMLYPGEFREEFSCIPREYMRRVAAVCEEFADSFPNVVSGLIFSGGPGLGKTYLSACIARRVAGKGYSVYYDTAVSVFQAFEKQQFGRTQEEIDSAAEKVRHMLSCDLFILDDLGTEVVTQVVQSGLYTLVNSRESAGKHSIISTACTEQELESRYSPSICSRLEGYFQRIEFAGDDIRKKRL